jgi:dipicolinate synthase subunit A
VQCLSEGQIFFAGVIPEAFKLAAQERRTTTYDLMVDHTLTVYNTIATAEGAICEAILRCPRNLHHSQCAVLGYGRCGNTLVSTLKGLSCIVSAYTDNPDKLAYAQVAADTAGTLDDFRANAGSFDLIFNTIPAMVIDESVLSTLNPNVTIIDIASAPGGVAFEAATEKHITAALCLGLPGKYAPASSATAIFECVERIVSSQTSHPKE